MANGKREYSIFRCSVPAVVHTCMLIAFLLLVQYEDNFELLGCMQILRITNVFIVQHLCADITIPFSSLVTLFDISVRDQAYEFFFPMWFCSLRLFCESYCSVVSVHTFVCRPRLQNPCISATVNFLFFTLSVDSVNLLNNG
jgi:hypothetical protein